MITHELGDVEYQESGEGDAILFVPGSFSTGASWRGLCAPLSERYRTITTSLCGYGQTQERRQANGAYLQDEMDVLETVLSRINAPVHLVAHSFGAWVALSLAVHRAPPLLSLTLLEPTVFHLLSLADETPLARHVQAMTDAYMAAWKQGDPRAIEPVIDFYGGPGFFQNCPPQLQAKFVAQTPTNVLDWQTGLAEIPSTEEFSALQTRTLVVCGSNSQMAMRRCNQLLVDRLPQAQFKMLDGANHFMIGTHAAQLNTWMVQHMQSH